jgi:hypothetical protein
MNNEKCIWREPVDTDDGWGNQNVALTMATYQVI